MDFLKSIAPIVGGIVGTMTGVGPGIGSGIATLLAGGDIKDAALAGVMGQGVGSLFGSGMQSAAGSVATDEATKRVLADQARMQAGQLGAKDVAAKVATEAAKKGGIFNTGLGLGDVSLLATLGGSLLGGDDDKDSGPLELESRPDYKGTPIKGLFIDQETGIAYDTAEELEEAIENELVKRLGPDARVNLDPPRAGRSALVLDGGAVRVLFAAGPALEVILFRLLAQYKAVLACRVTPKQKAQFVKLVQTHIKPKPVTLAIGDGANDVNMIMQAQVGVGICGLEGRQAVNAADFAIGQFRFLLRLLLVHGRWAYRRSATLILFSFYKNAVMAYCLFFYSTSTGFSGTSVYQSHFTSAYNIYLAAQIFWLGMFDRDADEGWILSHPRCYDSGRLNLDLSLKAVLAWQVNAVLHGIVIYYVGYGAMRHGRGGVYDSGSLGIFGTTLMIVIAVSMNFKAFVSSRTINDVTGGCGEKGGLGPLGFMASHKVVLFLNLAFFFGMSWYASTPACAEDTTAADMMEYWGVTHHTFEAGHTWLVALLVFGTWLFVDWVALACKWNFNATAVDALVERSHIARWTLDPSTKPFFFSKVAHVLPAEAQRVAPTDKVAREGAE